MLEGYFFHDERLGIPVPTMQENWNNFDMLDQHSVLLHWEGIRGQIPDRIAYLEQKINQKQIELSDENDFMYSCRLNNEIAELASVINDLWIWYRSSDDMNENKLEQ